MKSESIAQTKLAVVMACHNRRASTLSCLRALKEQKHLDNVSTDVYLLDDGSTDGTSEAVGAEFPHVHLLKGDGTLYWNRGMHESFSAAMQNNHDYYFWLNDDSNLYENALSVLLSTSAQLNSLGQKCAIVAGSMQDPKTGELTYGGSKRYRSRWRRIKQYRVKPTDRAIQCDMANGNCVLIPASVVEKVGNLDTAYKHRWGDHDYCLRALDEGCSVWLAPGYLGTCQRNSTKGTWIDASLSMLDRFRQLNSPQGYPFFEYARYIKRHRGLWWPAHLFWPYFKIILQALTPKSRQ